MSQPSSSPAASAIRADDLSIVLFGLPAAGKSSLLGALAQAAQTQEHLLNGRLTDVTHGLDELRRSVYEETPRRTAEEVVPYPVDFEPFSPSDSAQHVGAVVIDCDGRVANDLLVRRQALAEDSPEGTLAHEVTDADTLVLVIDASAPAGQVETDFAEFDRFLRQLEISRGQRTEVGGLPVFLVLTKCDLLAQPSDTAADWMERIEQQKRDVDARFRSFLARRQEESGPLPFGRLDLHLWATAIKRPALAGSPAKAREPYGVAELFRQCLEQAAVFRGRRRQSGRRLLWTVATATGMVAVMASLAVGISVRNRETPANALQEKVQILAFGDLPSAAERLHASLGELRDRAKKYADISNDPLFDSLPTDRQQFVRERLEELNAYLAYFDRLRQSPRPQDVHTEKALREIEQSLKTELAVPRVDWLDTDAAKLQATRLQDAKVIASAVNRVRNWYVDSVERADSLWTFQAQQTGTGTAGINWDSWTKQVENLLRPDRRLPISGADKVPDAATTLTYEATVQQFEEVLAARTDWDAGQGKLRRLLDVSAALGLAANVEKRPAVLVIPRQINLRQAGERSKTLAQAYPHYQRDFVLERLPDAIRPQIRQAARTNYEHLLEPGRAAVLNQLKQAGGGTEETPTRWESVRNWLRSPQELEGWRILATVLARLDDPEASDPVTALAEFLAKNSFALEIRRLTLEIPESLGVKPAPGAKLLVYHPASAGEKPALTFEAAGEGEGERDAPRRVWTYSFRSSDAQRLTYRPGDALWATLALRDDSQFTWVRAHSLLYQFERLTRPPRLHKTKEAATAGSLEEKVRLTLLPSDGVPRLPELMPVVRLEAAD